MTFFSLYCVCAGIAGMCYGFAQALHVHYSHHPRHRSIEIHEDKSPFLVRGEDWPDGYTLYPGRMVVSVRDYRAKYEDVPRPPDVVSVDEAAEYLRLSPLMTVPRPPRSDMEYFIK